MQWLGPLKGYYCCRMRLFQGSYLFLSTARKYTTRWLVSIGCYWLVPMVRTGLTQDSHPVESLSWAPPFLHCIRTRSTCSLISIIGFYSFFSLYRNSVLTAQLLYNTSIMHPFISGIFSGINCILYRTVTLAFRSWKKGWKRTSNICPTRRKNVAVLSYRRHAGVKQWGSRA